MRTVFRLLVLLFAIAFVGLAPAARAAPSGQTIRVEVAQAVVPVAVAPVSITVMDRMPLTNWPSSEVVARSAILLEHRMAGAESFLTNDRALYSVDYGKLTSPERMRSLPVASTRFRLRT